MQSEDNRLIINLNSLDSDTFNKIISYRKDSDTAVADALRKYLKSEESFEDTMKCPICHLSSGRTIPLKGLPILEAEKRGFIKINSAQSRNRAKEIGMYFCICPECLWWGIPDSTARRLS